ncbi:25773_t:CDS:2, partial [Racocetra persica]
MTKSQLLAKINELMITFEEQKQEIKENHSKEISLYRKLINTKTNEITNLISIIENYKKEIERINEIRRKYEYKYNKRLKEKDKILKHKKEIHKHEKEERERVYKCETDILGQTINHLEQTINDLQNQLSENELKKIEKQVKQCLTSLHAKYDENATLDQKMNELVELYKEFGTELPNFRSKRQLFQTKMLKVRRIKELTFEQKLDKLLRECFMRRQERKKQEGKETRDFDPKYSDTNLVKMQKCLFHLDVDGAYNNDNEKYNLEKILEEFLNSLKALKEENEKLKKQIKDYNDEKKPLNDKNTELIKEVEVLKQQIKDHEKKENEKLKQQVNDCNEEKKILQDKNKNLENKNNNLKEELKKYESNREKQDSKNKNTVLKQELEKCDTFYTNLDKKVNIILDNFIVKYNKTDDLVSKIDKIELQELIDKIKNENKLLSKEKEEYEKTELVNQQIINKNKHLKEQDFENKISEILVDLDGTTRVLGSFINNNNLEKYEIRINKMLDNFKISYNKTDSLETKIDLI